MGAQAQGDIDTGYLQYLYFLLKKNAQSYEGDEVCCSNEGHAGHEEEGSEQGCTGPHGHEEEACEQLEGYEGSQCDQGHFRWIRNQDNWHECWLLSKQTYDRRRPPVACVQLNKNEEQWL